MSKQFTPLQAETYLQHLTPFQKSHLKRVNRAYWLKWATALALVNGSPLLAAFVFNTHSFEDFGFTDALFNILEIASFFYLGFFPIFIILWIYLVYMLFSRVIPLQRDIIKGQKLMRIIPAEKYKMEDFNQFFIKTAIKNYPFLKVNEWTYNQIPDGLFIIFETAPRSGIYLGLRSVGNNEVILTESPESIY